MFNAFDERYGRALYFERLTTSRLAIADKWSQNGACNAILLGYILTPNSPFAEKRTGRICCRTLRPEDGGMLSKLDKNHHFPIIHFAGLHGCEMGCVWPDECQDSTAADPCPERD
jgi:hypothetical protein